MPPRGPRRRRAPKDRGGVAQAVTPVYTQTANFPELRIEWMPDGKPNDSDGTWVTLTPYVSDGSTKRGRQYELDQFIAGTAPLTLRTTTRLFDPENTAGAYYGKLLPMKQIRVVAVWQATAYPVWRGYVTSWGTTVQDDKLFVTTIATKDAFERLERIKLPSSAWALEILHDNPTAWFRLGESGTARITDSSPNGNYGVYDNCQQGAEGLVVNDSDGAVSFAHSLEERAVIQNPNLITGYPWTFSCMFRIDNSDPDGAKYLLTGMTTYVPGNSSGTFIFVGYTGTGLVGGIYVQVIATPTNYFVQRTSIRIDDNQPHHFAVVFNSASSFTLYVDGVDVTASVSATLGTPAFPGSPPNGWVIGNLTDILGGDFGFGTTDNAAVTATNPFPVKERGTIDEACFWDGTVIPASRIAAHALAAKTGWSGDTTGARATRFLDRIGWPTDLRDIEAGISTLGPASWSAGASALSVLQGWADTELGAFYMGKDGKLVWRSRHHPLLDVRATRPQATFGDAYSGEVLQYDNNGLDLPRDETQLRNPVTATRTNGVSVTVRDDNLADNFFGDRSYNSPTTEDRDDAAVRDRATWILNRYKQLASRIAKLTITPQRDPQNLWPVVLGLELGDRIRIKRTPAGVGAQIVLDFIVESIEHSFTAKTLWTTTFTGSPVDPNVGSYLILDDAASGVLDANMLAY